MTQRATDETLLVFSFFNEIGILSQLSLAEFRRALGPDLNTSEFGVLNHFVRVGDSVTPGDLARMFQVTKPSMTAIIRKLEAKGLVEVMPHTDDRRSKIVKITSKGRNQRERSIAATTPMAQRLVDEFGAERLSVALPHLSSLRAYLDEARNTSDKRIRDD